MTSKLPPEDQRSFQIFWKGELKKCEGEDAKRNKEDQILKEFAAWIKEFAHDYEETEKLSKGYKSMEPPTNSPGKSPK